MKTICDKINNAINSEVVNPPYIFSVKDDNLINNGTQPEGQDYSIEIEDGVYVMSATGYRESFGTVVDLITELLFLIKIDMA